MNNKTDKQVPDREIDVRKTFEIDIDMNVMAFDEPNEHVPAIDTAVSYTHLTLPTILLV